MSRRTNRVIWVSAELREELDEILLLLAACQAEGLIVHVDLPEALSIDWQPAHALPAGLHVVVRPARYSASSSAWRKLLGVMEFFGRVVRAKPVVLITGWSMMRHRVVSGLLRVSHVSYMRGVVFDPSERSGLSDWMSLRWWGRLLPFRAAHSYWADAVFTVGEVNKEFLVARGLPPAAIRLVGPVWLTPSGTDSPPPSPEPLERVFFLTSAWESHGLLEEHRGQLELTRRLVREWPGAQRLVLRAHPRDLHDYASDPAFLGVKVDRTAPASFLDRLGPGDLLVAPLSTLAFEAMYQGHAVVFYWDPVATRPFNHSYSRLGITPVTIDDLIAGNVQPQGEIEAPVFAPVDLKPFCDYVCGLVLARA